MTLRVNVKYFNKFFLLFIEHSTINTRPAVSTDLTISDSGPKASHPDRIIPGLKT